MKEFEFEIQNLINVKIKADNAEEARMILIDSLDDYADEMLDGSCYVSDGEELTDSSKDVNK